MIEGIFSFFTYLLLMAGMIPISLVVSMEFVKVSQAYFIESDDLLFCKKKNKWCSVSNASINEELGNTNSFLLINLNKILLIT